MKQLFVVVLIITIEIILADETVKLDSKGAKSPFDKPIVPRDVYYAGVNRSEIIRRLIRSSSKIRIDRESGNHTEYSLESGERKGTVTQIW
ncbi:hypothetical protein DdX_03065 [Ditylenchus destructor]|uniref:Uncharacterized protein n=1 Tax=Ditylenchus destructor TaxID=166010 RepID=A0AAD4RCE9_9BILA|nr:hypothetical protein DdX_03065 [Ditylenchus destructor]